MPLISQPDALAALGPHVDAIPRMIGTAWDEYHARIPQDMLISFCPRTRASAVHNLIVREATKYAAQREDARVFERSLMKGLVIDGRIAIRFKKLDEESLSRGHYTKQVREFRAQRQLDGIDAAHHLEIGYVLNQDETEISEVRVVCPSGRNVAWWARLDKSGIQPVVIDLLADMRPAAGDGGATVKPKAPAVIVPIRRKVDES